MRRKTLVTFSIAVFASDIAGASLADTNAGTGSGSAPTAQPPPAVQAATPSAAPPFATTPHAPIAAGST